MFGSHLVARLGKRMKKQGRMPKPVIGLVVIAMLSGLVSCDKTGRQSASEVAEPVSVREALSFHQGLVTVDTHIDIPVSLGIDSADPGVDGPMQVDLPKMRAGGLDVGFFIVYVGQAHVTPEGYREAYQQAQEKFGGIERMLNLYPEQIALARNPDEVQSILSQGKLVAAIGLENAYPLGPNLEHLQEFYDRGVRYASLTHFGNNHFADSSGRPRVKGVEEPVNDGISGTGFRLIEEMNRLGMMVDVSHTSPKATIQAAKVSKTPVIASHSGARSVYDHIRNMSDEEIIAVAEGGGVIQLVAFDSYMRDVSEEEKQRVKAIREKLGATGADWYKKTTQKQMGRIRQEVAALNAEFPRASVKALVDHIDYVVKLVGVDHAGISSDFGGGGGIQGWDHIAETENVTDELIARGYSEQDITKIWGGNLLRVWNEVDEHAKTQLSQ